MFSLPVDFHAPPYPDRTCDRPGPLPPKAGPGLFFARKANRMAKKPARRAIKAPQPKAPATPADQDGATQRLADLMAFHQTKGRADQAPKPDYMACNHCVEPHSCSFEERCAFPKMADLPVPAPIGRPSDFTEELSTSLLQWMSEGRSVASWCAPEDRPNVATVWKWCIRYPEFGKAYALAREAQADAIFDETIDIADNSADDWVMTKDGPRFNGEAARRSQIRIDTRLKVAARLNPKKYSEKLDLMIEDKRPQTAEARTARIAELLALGAKQNDPADGV